MTHLSRDMFQVKQHTKPLRKAKPCTLCAACDGNCAKCLDVAVIKLTHYVECAKCHHSTKYNPQPTAASVLKALDLASSCR